MKLKRIIFCLAIIICMLAACLPTAAAESQTPNGLWTDYAAASFEGGSGTKADPYKIASAEQLALLAKDVNSGNASKTHSREYFILTDNIDLSNHIWTPLGYESYASGSSQSFYGHFDGNGHKITGLYTDERGKNRSAGLFGRISACDSDSVVIQNLTVENGTVYAGDSTDSQAFQYGAGLLIGSITIMGGSHAEYATIKNCTVSGTVSSNMYAGGLVGDANYTRFENCQADVKVNGYCVSGGFVGNAFKSEFTDCTAFGDVKSKGWSTGGFAGVLFYETAAVHCAAFGNAEANDWNLGGFAGYTESDVTIKNSIATGDVSSSVTDWEPKVGGFIGSAYFTLLDKCHESGKISVKATDCVGSMIGLSEESNATNCSFDCEKNTAFAAIGNEISGTYKISDQPTAAVLESICTDYYGGHDFEEFPEVKATCTEDGREAGKKCSRCGYAEGFAVIKATGHDYKNGICKNCSAVKSANSSETAKTDTSAKSSGAEKTELKSPATGNTSKFTMPVIAVLILSVGAATGAIIYGSKKQNSDLK